MQTFKSKILVAIAVVLAATSQVSEAKWSLTSLPADQRAQTCQEQVSFCYNACRSVSTTATNFCNIRTMGWDCACASNVRGKLVRHYEWPIAVAECRAALAMCNEGCSSRTNPIERVSCSTLCLTDYPCNTADAPKSSLRVKGINDKPAGYVPPNDDQDIELTLGMKFDAGDSSSSDGKRKPRGNDPGNLPKIIPREGDSEGKDGGKGKGKGNGHIVANKGNGSGKDGRVSLVEGAASSAATLDQHVSFAHVAAVATLMLLGRSLLVI